MTVEDPAWSRETWTPAFSKKRDAERAVLETAVAWRQGAFSTSLSRALIAAIDRLIALG